LSADILSQAIAKYQKTYDESSRSMRTGLGVNLSAMKAVYLQLYKLKQAGASKKRMNTMAFVQRWALIQEEFAKHLLASETDSFYTVLEVELKDSVF
jgi:hypothetical protein